MPSAFDNLLTKYGGEQPVKAAPVAAPVSRVTPTQGNAFDNLITKYGEGKQVATPTFREPTPSKLKIVSESAKAGVKSDILGTIGSGINEYNKWFYNTFSGGKGVTGESYEPQYEQNSQKIKQFEDKTQEKLVSRIGEKAANSYLSKATRGVTQGIGQISTFAISPVLGFTTLAAQTIDAGKDSYDEAYKTTIEQGRSEEEAKKIANINGIVTGTVGMLEAVPVFRALGIGKDVLLKPVKKTLAATAGRMLKTTAIESGTEGVQQLAGDLTAQATYKPNETSFKNAIEAVLVSLPTALIFGGVGEAGTRIKTIEKAKEDITKKGKEAGLDDKQANEVAENVVNQYVAMGDEDTFADHKSRAERSVGIAENQVLNPQMTPEQEAMNKIEQQFKSETTPADQLISHEGAPDTARVAEYKAKIQAGEQIDPLKIIDEGEGKFGIEDGKHRYEAYKQLGIKDIPTETLAAKAASDINKVKSYGQSFDEWMNGQGDRLYHGTQKGSIENINKVGIIDTGRGGISLTSELNTAKGYAAGNGEVLDTVLLPNAKLIDGNEFEKIVDDIIKKTKSNYVTKSEQLNVDKLAAEEAKKLGFDGADYRKSGTVSLDKGEVRVWNTDKIKTRSQLKAEWDKSGTVETKAQKTAKAAKDVNKMIVEKGFDAMPDEELAKFSPITKKDQIEKVTNLLSTDLEGAKEMATGKKPVMGDIHPQVVYNAVVAHAEKSGDIDLMRSLAKSPLAEKLSESAQTLSARAFNMVNNSVVSKIQEIQKVINKKVGDVKKKKSEIVKEIKDNIKKPTKQDWASFVESIKC